MVDTRHSTLDTNHRTTASDFLNNYDGVDINNHNHKPATSLSGMLRSEGKLLSYNHTIIQSTIIPIHSSLIPYLLGYYHYLLSYYDTVINHKFIHPGFYNKIPSYEDIHPSHR